MSNFNVWKYVEADMYICKRETEVAERPRREKVRENSEDNLQDGKFRRMNQLYEEVIFSLTSPLLSADNNG